MGTALSPRCQEHVGNGIMMFTITPPPSCSSFCPSRVAGGPDESVQQPVWNPSGSRLYYISDAGSGWWNLFEYDTSTETSTKLLDLPADFGWPQWWVAACMMSAYHAMLCDGWGSGYG
jgi:hypothetical protein